MRLISGIKWLLFVAVLCIQINLFAQVPPSWVEYRVQLIVRTGPDYTGALQYLDAKPEVTLNFWDPQTGVAEFSADARVTPELIKQALAAHYIKVVSIQLIQP